MLTSLIFKITELLIPHKYFGIAYWNGETDYEAIWGYPQPSGADMCFMVISCLLFVGLCIGLFIYGIWTYENENYIKTKVITFGLACVLCAMWYVFVGTKDLPRIIFYVISFLIIATFLYKMNEVYNEFNKAPYTNYDASQREKLTEVNFQTIKDLYKLSPQRFSIPNYYKDNLCYRNCSYTTDQKRKTEYPSLVESRTYYLTIHKRIDFIKFYIWAFKLSKEAYVCDMSKKNTAQFKQEQENLKVIINQAQVDIDKIKKQSEQELNKAKSTIRKVNEVNNVLH